MLEQIVSDTGDLIILTAMTSIRKVLRWGEISIAPLVLIPVFQAYYVYVCHLVISFERFHKEVNLLIWRDAQQ
jgi:hypothetical protein